MGACILRCITGNVGFFLLITFLAIIAAIVLAALGISVIVIAGVSIKATSFVATGWLIACVAVIISCVGRTCRL